MIDYEEIQIGGNEDGCVTFTCTRRACMRQGLRGPGNPEGLWFIDYELPYHPTVEQIRDAILDHVATHDT